MIGYGWGMFAIQYFFPRGNIYYIIQYPVGRFTIQQIFRGGMLTTPREGLLCEGLLFDAGTYMFMVYVPNQESYQFRGHFGFCIYIVGLLSAWYFFCLFFNFVKVKQKVTSNLKATHLESHTAIQEVRVWARSELAPLLSDFQM